MKEGSWIWKRKGSMESSCNSRWRNNSKNLSLLNPIKGGEEEGVPNLTKPHNRILFSCNSNNYSSRIESLTTNNSLQVVHKAFRLSNNLCHINNHLHSMALPQLLIHNNLLCISKCLLNSSNPLAIPCTSNSPTNPRCSNLYNSSSPSLNLHHIHPI